ncbi:MAG TPA: hypothetical protein DHV68_03010 [Dehalococcoidia bacterium]|nr:hypothetical protein [Chloroflexota bacterium]HCI85796.1 hypothetical protein [Dehalococcoidia bacterium]
MGLLFKLTRSVAGFVLLFAVILSCSTESEPTVQSQPTTTTEPAFERVTQHVLRAIARANTRDLMKACEIEVVRSN